MKTKNIDEELVELQNKFEKLEVRQTQLLNRIKELEQKKAEQSKRVEHLQVKSPKSTIGKQLIDDIQAAPLLTQSAFQEGDLIQVTNHHNGQHGVIGKIYRVTKCQVHFTDIRHRGGSISRAFGNVKLLNLSNEEKTNLLYSYKHGRRTK